MKLILDAMPIVCEFDGCSYGVRDGGGLPLKTPWRVVTNRAELSGPLGRKCSGDHQHGQCRGASATYGIWHLLAEDGDDGREGAAAEGQRGDRGRMWA